MKSRISLSAFACSLLAITATLFVGINPAQATAQLPFTQITSIPNMVTGNTDPKFVGSADGTKVIATSNNLYLSTNSGSTFSLITPSAWVGQISSHPVSATWISNDGTKIIAAQNPGDMAISTNSGATWRYLGFNGHFTDITASADMSHIYAITSGHSLYVSTDSGINWYSTASGGTDNPFISAYYGTGESFVSIQASSDGSNVEIVGRDDFYRSTDFGVTWTTNQSIDGVHSSCCFYSAMSTSGQVVLVGFNGNGFYLSTDYGTSFTQIPSSTFATLPSQSQIHGFGTGVSPDGTQLVAYDFGMYIYTSADGGATWTAQTNLGVNSWAGRAFVDNSGNIFLQSNGTENWITGSDGAAYKLTGASVVVAPSVTAPSVVAPIVIPDPIQKSAITALSTSSIMAGTLTPFTLTGTFAEKVTSVQIDGVALAAGSWKQTPTSLTFTVGAQKAGVHSIQVFDGSAPVLASQVFTVVAAPSTTGVTSKSAPKATYLECMKGTHMRIAHGVNPVCPIGFTPKK